MQRNKKRAALLLIVSLAVGLSSCGFLSEPENVYPEKSVLLPESSVVEESVVRRPESPEAYLTPEMDFVTERVTEEDERQSSGSEETPHEAVFRSSYVYGTLTEEEKTVYDEILACILSHESKVTVSTLDKDLLDRCYEAVNADHGGLFWLDGYVYTIYRLAGNVTDLEFSPKYTMDYEERLAMQQSIDASVEQLLGGVSLSDSDYDKAKYVFETLVSTLEYDLSAPENQNIISAFVYRRTVCQGYACATQYLLSQLGIQSFIVTGTANSENHAWNMVCLDGSYYCMDTTWGNSLVSASDDRTGKFCNYAYLNTTTEDLRKTHHSDSLFPLPESSNMENNYYVKEGLYFSEWLPDDMGELISTAWFSGPRPITLKFSDSTLYQKAMSYFITEGHMADFCPGLTNYTYFTDADQNVMTIIF